MSTRRLLLAALPCLLVSSVLISTLVATGAEARPASQGTSSPELSDPQAAEDLRLRVARLEAELESHRMHVEAALKRLHEVTLRVALFHPARVVAASKLGQDVEERFNAFRIALEADLRDSKQELQRFVEEQRARAAEMSDDEREAARERLEQRLRDHDELRLEVAAKLERRNAELMVEVERLIARAVRQLAERDGFALVLRRSLVDHATDALDVSDEIVRLMDAERAAAGEDGAPSQR